MELLQGIRFVVPCVYVRVSLTPSFLLPYQTTLPPSDPASSRAMSSLIHRCSHSHARSTARRSKTAIPSESSLVSCSHACSTLSPPTETKFSMSAKPSLSSHKPPLSSLARSSSRGLPPASGLCGSPPSYSNMAMIVVFGSAMESGRW